MFWQRRTHTTQQGKRAVLRDVHLQVHGMDGPVSASHLSQLCLRTASAWHIRKNLVVPCFIQITPKIGCTVCLHPLPQHADNNTYHSLYHCKSYFIFARYSVDRVAVARRKSMALRRFLIWCMPAAGTAYEEHHK